MPGDTDEAKVVQSQMDNMSLESQVGFWGGGGVHVLSEGLRGQKSDELDVMQNL